ncbi:excisionase [Sansalvadorimonas verongulae]|nr:excisionase [Sansalvadorimonas verongulae]
MASVAWVRPQKLSQETGYSEKAIQNKIDRGDWAQGVVWRKAPDGNRLINIEEFNKWAESRPQT